MQYNQITHDIIKSALLESAYKECLAYELLKNEIFLEKEKPLPLIYEEVHLECGYRIDLLIERKVVIWFTN